MTPWGYRCLGVLIALAVSLSAKPQTPAEEVYEWLVAQRSGTISVDSLLSPSDFKPALVEAVELRTETDGFDWSRQRYSVRARPLTPARRRAEQRLQQSQRAVLQRRGQEGVRDADRDALLRLAELVTDRREIALVDSLRALQRTLVKLYELRLAEAAFDVERLLDAQDDLANLDLRESTLTARIDQGNLPLPSDRYVNVPSIRARLASLRVQTPVVDLRGAEIAVIDAEMQLERAENKQWIDFLALEYRAGEDLLADQLRVGGSIRLPQRELTLRALDELRIERAEEAFDQAADEREAALERDEHIRTLELLLAEYTAARASYRQRAATRSRLLNVYQSNLAAQPERTVKLQRRNLRDALALLSLEEQILEEYFQLLGLVVVMDAPAVAEWVLD